MLTRGSTTVRRRTRRASSSRRAPRSPHRSPHRSPRRRLRRSPRRSPRRRLHQSPRQRRSSRRPRSRPEPRRDPGPSARPCPRKSPAATRWTRLAARAAPPVLPSGSRPARRPTRVSSPHARAVTSDRKNYRWSSVYSKFQRIITTARKTREQFTRISDRKTRGIHDQQLHTVPKDGTDVADRHARPSAARMASAPGAQCPVAALT